MIYFRRLNRIRSQLIFVGREVGIAGHLQLGVYVLGPAFPREIAFLPVRGYCVGARILLRAIAHLSVLRVSAAKSCEVAVCTVLHMLVPVVAHVYCVLLQRLVVLLFLAMPGLLVLTECLAIVVGVVICEPSLRLLRLVRSLFPLGLRPFASRKILP